MSDAPERIWAVPERNCTVYMSGNSPITAQDGPFTHHLHGEAHEYIRADLVPALSVTVKPLEWDCDFAAVNIPEGYSVYDNSDGDLTVYMVWRTGSEKLNDSDFSTIEAAKAAAQADYEDRILSSIQPTKDSTHD